MALIISGKTNSRIRMVRRQVTFKSNKIIKILNAHMHHKVSKTNQNEKFHVEE